METGTPSELAASEMPVSEVGAEGEGEAAPPALATFPPYPPYVVEPAPPSVADTIIAGHDLRLQHKSVARKPVRPPPKPAKPRGPKATDVKLSKRAMRAHSRCLRRHGAILTDRLERMSKPLRRNIIYLWREHANTLPPETIARLRAMLDADEPFKPDQAYEYFVNLKKTKKKNTAAARVNEIKKDVLAMVGEKRFQWARNATVAFARGIQQRLSRPGRYALADGMLRLSNIVLDDICNYMHMRTPSRRSTNPKAKFMMEMSDKVAVWIDEILNESDERMLMMDFDEDEEVLKRAEAGDADSFTDDFLDMMGGGSGRGGRGYGPGGDDRPPAYTRFKGDQLEAFKILTEAMDNKGNENLLKYELFDESYKQGADELKKTTDLDASDYTTTLANDVNKKLTEATKAATPQKIAPAMKGMVEDASNFLAQNAEYNKAKGPEFQKLVKAMHQKPNEKLFQKDKITRTNKQAATQLEKAKGLEVDHDDPTLTSTIYDALANLINRLMPGQKTKEMDAAIDTASKYLSQKAVDETERGPAFDLMVKELEKKGGDPFVEKFAPVSTKYATAYTLNTAPGLTNVTPDPQTETEFKAALHKAVDASTPKEMKPEMNDVIDRSSKYLSAFVRDRGEAMNKLIDMMKSKPDNVFSTRNEYTMDYAKGVKEIENAPTIVPYLPVKDIANEGKEQLAKDMEEVTPPELKTPMRTLIQDVSKYLSQPVALRSGAAGEGYGMKLLAAVKKSLGSRPLFKTKAYGETYAEAADDIKKAGHIPSEEVVLDESAKNLKHEIKSELKRGVPTRLAPTITEDLAPTMDKAANYLAEQGSKKGKAVEKLVEIMKEKGDEPLTKAQGYDQTYNDGARRIEAAPTLQTEKVDKPAYEDVKKKLTKVTAEKPEKIDKSIIEEMPEVIDKTSQFLAAPQPETEAEKKQVLADLMGRKGDEILDEKKIYKLTYKEGGEEVKEAPVGKTSSHDQQKKQEMVKKIQEVIPDKKMEKILKDAVQEGAAHLADVTEGRDQAMEVIRDGLDKKKDEEFIEVGSFKKSHEEAAKMLEEAPHFDKNAQVSPVIMDKVSYKIDEVPLDIPEDKPMAKEHIKEASELAAKFIAETATRESGLNAEQLAALDEAGFNDDSKAAAEAKRKAVQKGKKTGTEADEDEKDATGKKRKEGADADEKDAAGKKRGEGAEEDARTVAGKKDGVGAEESERSAAGKKDGVGAEEGERSAAGKKDGVGADEKAAAAKKSAEGAESEEKEGVGADGQKKAGGGRTGDKKSEGDSVRSGSGRKGKGGGYGPDEDGQEFMFGMETEEQRRRRLAEAAAHRKWEEAERKRLGDKEYFRQLAEKRAAMGIGSGKYRGGALGADYDPEHEAALDILHRELRAKGSETFYQQPQTSLSHVQASDWLAMPEPMKIDKTVRESGDTDRLHRKFEKKLCQLVGRVTPQELYDSMQDVVIESARRLSEFFVAKNYQALVKDALISGMQKRGNEILTEVDGAAETFFFAAQRLKKAKTLDVKEPCSQVAYQISKKLEDMMRSRPMARKLSGTMKDHIKDASNFLSALVTKPDDHIEAYIALLDEMEAAADANLIEGDIPKSHKEAADYLRQLTSFEDQIGLPNASLQSNIENKLQNLMSNVQPSGYSRSVMDKVIAESTTLLVSYIMLQGNKTEALQVLVQEMDTVEDNVLLRHGPLRKSFKEGADLLRGKNTDQIGGQSADPVVSRKIQIKLNNLMENRTPSKYEALMDDVIEDATTHMAVQFLEPKVIKVCKCRKNVFVQCELWFDEILRRVARPCCTCSRHVSAQALRDLVPTQNLSISPDSSSMDFAPGLQISVVQCPAIQTAANRFEPQRDCPTSKPTSTCPGGPTTSYLLYSTSTNKKFGYRSTRLLTTSSSDTHMMSSPIQLSGRTSPVQSLIDDIHSTNLKFEEQQLLFNKLAEAELSTLQGYELGDKTISFHTPNSANLSETSQGTQGSQESQGSKTSYPYETFPSPTFGTTYPETPTRITQAKSGFSARAPIISTDQMADWHAMMVSLMWNVQAWRDWIQENVDRALAYQYNPNVSREEASDNWSAYQRKVSTEALQWRQYCMFSRQLTTRLALRYRDKEIVSPIRTSMKTKTYLECQEEMLEIIDMFNRWTQWLTLVIKETDSLENVPGSDMPLHELRWHHLKKKVEEYASDWTKYNMHLKVSWEHNYCTLIADHLPLWKQPGPVWVVSACGAVPSGAVAAGIYDGEVIWVARTTHRCNVLPAALYPSKHCCLVYADGAIQRYTKYQVMCNAEVRWVAWRGGSIGGRAVRVAAGVHVGRVHYHGNHLLGAVHEPHYRCQVVIFGRPFAFNCYELLMLADGEDQ